MGMCDVAGSVTLGRARADVGDDDVSTRLADVQPAILASIEAGNFPAVAAQAQGVPLRTWQRWRQKADQGDERFIDLFEAVSCSLARCEEKLVSVLMSPPTNDKGQSDQGWIRSTQFMLERTRRERWGDRVEVRVRVEDTVREMLEELKARMSVEAFDELAIALSEIGAPGADPE